MAALCTQGTHSQLKLASRGSRAAEARCSATLGVAPRRRRGACAPAPPLLPLEARARRRGACAPPKEVHDRRAATFVTAALPGMDADQLPVPRAELPKWLAVAALGASVLAQRSGYRRVGSDARVVLERCHAERWTPLPSRYLRRSWQLTQPLVLQGLTWYSLIWAGLSALDSGSFGFDRVASFVGGCRAEARQG